MKKIIISLLLTCAFAAYSKSTTPEPETHHVTISYIDARSGEEISSSSVELKESRPYTVRSPLH